MFESPPNPSELLRRFTQEDIAATGIRASLSFFGPIGVIAGEFLTQVVPQQRLDRLQDFVEHLNAKLAGLEEHFNERLSSSAGFAALTEAATVEAVRSTSTEHRADLAALLRHGLSRADADMLEEEAMLSLRGRLNEAQVIILMSYGNFKRTHDDAELPAFWAAHPGVFSVRTPTLATPPEERRAFTMYLHYEAELAAWGLLQNTGGVVLKSGQRQKYIITALGRLLLQAIGRYRGPRAQE